MNLVRGDLKLPEEIWYQIFGFLSSKDISNVSEVDKTFYLICEEIFKAQLKWICQSSIHTFSRNGGITYRVLKFGKDINAGSRNRHQVYLALKAGVIFDINLVTKERVSRILLGSSGVYAYPFKDTLFHYRPLEIKNSLVFEKEVILPERIHFSNFLPNGIFAVAALNVFEIYNQDGLREQIRLEIENSHVQFISAIHLQKGKEENQYIITLFFDRENPNKFNAFAISYSCYIDEDKVELKTFHRRDLAYGGPATSYGGQKTLFAIDGEKIVLAYGGKKPKLYLCDLTERIGFIFQCSYPNALYLYKNRVTLAYQRSIHIRNIRGEKLHTLEYPGNDLITAMSHRILAVVSQQNSWIKMIDIFAGKERQTRHFEIKEPIEHLNFNDEESDSYITIELKDGTLLYLSKDF